MLNTVYGPRTLLVIRNCNNFATGGELAQKLYPAREDGSLWRLRAQKSKTEGFVSLVLTGEPPAQEHAEFEHPYWILYA
jgi:hypothetical protein